MKLDSENTNFNLRHLRAVHAIWQEGSFVRAAERLGVVPSALTETVRQIEVIAGGTLFDRRSRPPEPTALGLAYLEDTRPLLDQIDGSLTRLRDRARGLQGTLRIGATPSAISTRIAPAITAFRAAYPDHAVLLHDDIAETLAQMVADDRLDLAVAGRARSSPDLMQAEIGTDRIGLACHRDHPLAQAGQAVRLRDIDPAEIIHLSADTGTAQLLAESTQLPAAMKSGPLRSHSTVGQLCLIRAGAGVALLPRNAVLLFNDPDLRCLEIADLHVERRLYLLRPARRALPRAADAFVTALGAEPPDPAL